MSAAVGLGPLVDFSAQAFFSFDSVDSHRLFRLFDSAAADGHAAVDVEWIGALPGGIPKGTLQGDALFTAMAEFLRTQHPRFHEAFVAAAFGLVHGDRVDLAHPGVMARALRVAGVDLDEIATGATDEGLRAALETSTRRATELGVKAVPSLYRHGPVVLVRTTAAVLHGSPKTRMELLSLMLEDDGVWELSKP